MSSNLEIFTKENLDLYLKELGKEFKKLNGKTTQAEIILIGGASILANYGFRNSTNDIDVVIHASSVMKDAINKVGDKYNLPNGWINTDFTRTPSYSTKLFEVSKYYKTFSNVLAIRTISDEYLIAMKLMAGRKYKNDLSDIVGILYENQRNNKPITKERTEKAIVTLYGDLSAIPADSISFMENLFNLNDYEGIYNQTKAEESVSREILIDFEEKYPKSANDSNVNDILKSIKSKKGKL